MNTTLYLSEIIHDTLQNQFQMHIGKFIAVVNYKMKDGKMYLTHSEVPYHLRNQVFEQILLENIFAYIEKHQIEAIAVCTYIRYVKRQSEKWNKIIGE